MFHYLMLHYFNVQQFDTVLAAVALVHRKLVLVAKFNVAVF